MRAQLLDVPIIRDERGALISFESMLTLPFHLKRVYFLYDVTASRGFHAHKSLEQVAVCLKGSCEILLDDGVEQQNVVLNKSNVGLCIPRLTWREMHNFSADCILAILASENYCESDYIREYGDFLKEVKVAK